MAHFKLENTSFPENTVETWKNAWYCYQKGFLRKQVASFFNPLRGFRRGGT